MQKVILHNCKTVRHFMDAEQAIREFKAYGPKQKDCGFRFGNDDGRTYFVRRGKSAISSLEKLGAFHRD